MEKSTRSGERASPSGVLCNHYAQAAPWTCTRGCATRSSRAVDLVTRRNTAPILERAWHIEARYQLSWWDALIVASAQTVGCRYLLTEDLQHGQDIDGLLVVSRFRMTPEDLA